MNFHGNYRRKLHDTAIIAITNRNFINVLYRSEGSNILSNIIILFYVIKGIFSKKCLQILRYVMLILFKKNKKDNFQILLQFISFFMENNIIMQKWKCFKFSAKKKKLPKSLSHISFIVRRQIGPLLILNKKESLEILNNKITKPLLKYSKKMQGCEEWIYQTLYFNILGDTKKSLNPLALNLKQNDYAFINSKYNKKEFLFLRQIVGKEAIEKINKKVWLKSKD